jgi:MFS family permease
VSKQPVEADWRDLITRQHLPTLALMALALWLHATNTMLAATTLPVAAEEIGGVELISWAFSLYLLGSVLIGTTMSIIVTRRGLRQTMIASAAVYLIGCLLCVSAQHMSLLLVGRAIQGIGGGGMVALVFIIQSRYFSTTLIPRVVASMSVVWMASAFCGPMIGGVFATLGIWRFAFAVFAAQALLLILIVRRLVPPEQPTSHPQQLNLPVIRLTMLTASVLMVCAASTTRDYAASVSLVLGGMALLCLFVWRDASLHQSDAPAATRNAMLPRGAAQLTHPVGAGMALTICLTASMMSFVVYGPIILIRLYGLTPLSAGFVLIVESLSWSLSAVIFSGRAAGQERTIVLAGSVAVVLGITAQTLTVPDTSVTLIALSLIISCAGFGAIWGYIIKGVITSVDTNDNTRASSIMPVTQQIGFALGAALAGVIANGLGFSDASDNQALRSMAPWLFAGFYPLALAGCLFAWWFSAGVDNAKQQVPTN